MKLIDIEKVINDPSVFAIGKEEIEKYTVKAIPKEWIEKYAKRFIELENRNYFAYRGFSDTGKAILHMLEEWEKENERP